VTNLEYVDFGGTSKPIISDWRPVCDFWGTSGSVINDQPLVRDVAYYSFFEVGTEVYVRTACIIALSSFFLAMN
jgi:hypothetical protein